MFGTQKIDEPTWKLVGINYSWVKDAVTNKLKLQRRVASDVTALIFRLFAQRKNRRIMKK